MIAPLISLKNSNYNTYSAFFTRYKGIKLSIVNPNNAKSNTIFKLTLAVNLKPAVISLFTPGISYPKIIYADPIVLSAPLQLLEVKSGSRFSVRVND